MEGSSYRDINSKAFGLSSEDMRSFFWARAHQLTVEGGTAGVCEGRWKDREACQIRGNWTSGHPVASKIKKE